MKKKLTFGTIADPIATFNPEAETTFFLLHEMTRRGHESWIMELKDLFLDGGELKGTAQRIGVTKKGRKFSYQIQESKTLSLKKLDCLFLRKDPPVDLEYIDHLTMLETLEGSGYPLIINSPSGIKKANEKIYPLTFPGVSPPSLISKSSAVMLAFIKEHRRVVLKPLNGSGGQGIVIVQHGDLDSKSLMEMATNSFSRYVMLQKFVPEALKGDKRILVFNGQPLGSFLRVPAKGDFRGNMHSGARWVRSKISAHEKKVIDQLRPRLLQDGLIFVGLDFVGPYLTEINSTSPMGIREINQLYGTHAERIILDWVERS